MMYAVHWIQSLEDLLPWEAPFKTFASLQNSFSRFTQWDALVHYATLFKDKMVLRIGLLTQADGTIVAGLLLKQDRKLTLNVRLDFVGTFPDTTDANLIMMHPEVDEDVLLPQLANALLNAPFRWDWLGWRFIEKDEHCIKLLKLMDSRWVYTSMAVDLIRLYLPLPATEAEYLKSRSSRVKKFVNNKQNRIKRELPNDPYTFRWIPPEETGAIMDWLMPRYLEYWAKNGIKTQIQQEPFLETYYRDCLAKNLMQLTGFFIGDRPACVFVGYHVSPTVYMLHFTCYEQEFMDYSTGILHIDNLIRTMIAQGYTMLDFGIGDLEYKRYFTQQVTPTWSFYTFRTHRSYLYFKFKHLAVLARDTIKGSLKRLKAKAAAQKAPPTDVTPQESATLTMAAGSIKPTQGSPKA
jgi:CelD/BcsL family acetyltransferase involved in cellulose biosynthesis